MPKILMRRDTAANWTSANPTLASGEWALETDTGKMKLGDGTTAYNTLSYYTKEDDEWTKPADWPDIRSGAKDNSVYFLVGHGRDIHDLEKYYTIENGVLTAADNRVYWHNTEHGGGYGGNATYFKAGFVPTNKTTFELVCKRIHTTDSTSEGNSSPFMINSGTYDGVSYKAFGFNLQNSIRFLYFATDYKWSSISYNDLFTYKFTYSSQLTSDSYIVNITNDDGSVSDTLTCPTVEDQTCFGELYIGSYHYGYSDGRPSVPYYPFEGDFYYAKFWEDGTLIRHFVPVPEGLKIGSFTVPKNGLFDIVNQQFYEPFGNGDFMLYVQDDTYGLSHQKAGFYVETKNHGTYDIYIDGNKLYTSADKTSTVIDFPALYLEGKVTDGPVVSYPEPLITHIVRVTPTDPTDEIVKMQQAQFSTDTHTGLLWAHFTLTNAVNLPYFIYGKNDKGYAPVLESVTAVNDTITSTDVSAVFARGTNMKYVPWISGLGRTTDTSLRYYAQQANQIRKFKFKNMRARGGGVTWGNNALEEILYDNVDWYLQAYRTFVSSLKLKKVPCLPYELYNGVIGELFDGSPNIEDLVIDYSGSNLMQRFDIGNGNHFGIKGITVSPEAPFDSNTSPQLKVTYAGLDRSGLVNLFNSMPDFGFYKVGSPTVTNGIASNFSANNYFITNKSFDLTTTVSIESFELFTKVTTPSVIQQTAHGIGIIGGDAQQPIGIHLSNGSTPHFGAYLVSSHGVGGWQVTDVEVLPDTTYYLKYTLTDNTHYTMAVSTDNQTWKEASSSLGTVTVSAPRFFRIGAVGYYSSYWGGTIDLNNTYLKINGEMWFDAKNIALQRTCSIVGCTGTSQLTQEDKDIVLNKGWALTTS